LIDAGNGSARMKQAQLPQVGASPGLVLSLDGDFGSHCDGEYKLGHWGIPVWKGKDARRGSKEINLPTG
jgi:hypothetical protein